MLYSSFKQNVTMNPAKVAVSFENRHFTYAELDYRILNAAKNLHVLGVRTGTKAVLAISSPCQFLVLYFALSRLGATAVVVPPNIKYRYLKDLADELKPKFYFVEHQSAIVFNRVLAQQENTQFYTCREGKLTLSEIEESLPEVSVSLPKRHFEDEEFVIHVHSDGRYLKGKTSKITVQTQKTHVARLMNIASTLSLEPHDVSLSHWPIHHQLALESLVLPGLISGQQVVFMSPNESTAQNVINTLALYDVTVYGSCASHYESWLHALSDHLLDLSKTRIALCFGEPVNEAQYRETYRRFGLRINNTLSSDETSLISVNLHLPGNPSVVNVGKPIIGVEVEIDPAYSLESCIGELKVRSNGTAYSQRDVARWYDGQYHWHRTGAIVKWSQGFIEQIGGSSKQPPSALSL